MSTENVSSDQQKDIIADYANEIQQIQMEGNERLVRKARNALFWAGGLIFFWEMIAMFRTTGFDPLIFIIALVEGGIFIALAFWTRKKPYSAIITGLVVFIVFIALSVVVNGMVEGGVGVLKALFSGIIVKVIILVNLILPIKDAKELQEARKNNF
jgi:uncharacterized membrane protein